MSDQDNDFSINPKDAIISGKLNDLTATITNCRYEMYKGFNGNSPEKFAMIVTYTDDAGEDHEQAYSCGKAGNFIPSDDGTKAVPTGTIKGFNALTSFMRWATSFVEAGFPTTRFNGSDCTVFTGYKVHLLNKSFGSFKGDNGKDIDNTVLCVARIIADPSQTGTNKGTGKSATGTKAAAGTTAKSASTLDVNTAAKDLIMGAIIENGGTVTKALVGKYVLTNAQALKKADANYPLKDVVQLTSKEDFVTGNSEWTYDTTTQQFSLPD